LDPKLSLNRVKRPHRQSRHGLSDGVASAASARLLAIGLVAGVFSALFGVGGGIVIVPLLVALAGFETRRATGTSLAAISITAGAGALFYGLHGDLKVGSAALLGLPAALGAVAGVALQQRLQTRTLTIGFSLFLTAVAIRLLV
jgi:hypothetical protein